MGNGCCWSSIETIKKREITHKDRKEIYTEKIVQKRNSKVIDGSMNLPNIIEDVENIAEDIG